VSLVTGLFHRAIIQSGSVLNPWAFDDPSVARRKAFRFGEVLGCHTSDSKELLEFLMKVPAQKLVDGMALSLTEEVRTACKGRIDLYISIVHVEKLLKIQLGVILKSWKVGWMIRFLNIYPKIINHVRIKYN
jgi:carboxylesterase type B